MITNFAEVVSSVLYRGSRPQVDDFKGQLAQMKSIVDLEGDDVSATEYTSVPEGVTFFWCPISLPDIYAEGFPAPLVDYALAYIEAAPKPVYVHCQHGEDRTGLLVAAYRIKKQGWAPQQAYQEALRYGYHPHFNAGLNKNFEALGVVITDWVI